jgi:hypothetical protein
MALLTVERIERPASLFGPSAVEEEIPANGGRLGGGLTLDDAIVGAWEGLAARATIACPLCDGAMRPGPGTDDANGGRCQDCGTTLL